MIVLIKVDILHKITGIEYLKEQFITLFTVFSHQGGEILQRRGFYRFECESLEHLTNGVEDIVTPCHFDRQKISGSFRYAAFHGSMTYC